jgi:hypothetical protein
MDDIYSEIVEPKKKAGFLQVIEVLYSPKKTFLQVMDAGHSWIFPFILFSVILAVAFISGIPEMEQQSQELAPLGLSQENVSAFMTAFTIIFSIIIAPIVVIIGIYLIPSLVSMFFENFVLAGSAGLRQVMNVIAFAAVPLSIGFLISSAVSFISGVPGFSFSPQIFLPESMRATFLGMWLGIFNLFSIWGIVLSILGLAALYHHRPGTTAAWLIPLYLAGYTLMVFLGSLATRISSNLTIPQ